MRDGGSGAVGAGVGAGLLLILLLSRAFLRASGVLLGRCTGGGGISPSPSLLPVRAISASSSSK